MRDINFFKSVYLGSRVESIIWSMLTFRVGHYGISLKMMILTRQNGELIYAGIGMSHVGMATI